MQGGPPALGGRAMGVQEVPDDAVKYFLLRRGERHAKQPQFKWFMLYKADEMAGFSFPEMTLFIKLFNQGKPPGDHGQDVGGSFPYLVVVALFMLAVMVNGLRTEGNFFCQREHEMREEAVFTGVNAFREFQIVFKGNSRRRNMPQVGRAGILSGGNLSQNSFPATVKSLAPRSEASRRCLRKAASMKSSPSTKHK